jgi:hypothetical protein
VTKQTFSESKLLVAIYICNAVVRLSLYRGDLALIRGMGQQLVKNKNGGKGLSVAVLIFIGKMNSQLATSALLRRDAQ